MRPLFALIAVPALAFLLGGCSSQVAGGSTTETTNTVTASVVDGAGAGVSRALARLRPAGYLPSLAADGRFEARTVRDGESDPAGRVRFDSLPAGAYALELSDRDGKSVLRRFEIPPQGARVDLGACALAAGAAVHGALTADSAAGTVRVEIYGLERQAKVSPPVGEFRLLDLPAGTYTLRATPLSAGYGSVTRALPELEPGRALELDTLRMTSRDLEDYSQWARVRTLRINTTASGAGVGSDVAAFPVHIALTAADFDFRQARPDGGDLRFSGPGGARLPYEIAAWLPDSGIAGVWVLVDTVRGNDSTQSIRMHWGKPEAPDFSDGARVFRAADGFAGVWHFDGSALDATSRQNHGAIAGAGFSGGPMGLAAVFPGAGGLITVPDAPALDFGTGDFTATVWARLDRLGATQQVFSKRVPLGGHLEIQVQADGKARAHLRLLDSASYLESRDPLEAGRWHCLGLVRAAGSARLFVDGVAVDTLESAADVGSDGALLFGGDIEGPESLLGAIDEAHLAAKARSDAWMKLRFENGKPGGRMIRME